MEEDQVRGVFDALKAGLESLSVEAERGDLQSVQVGLAECLAAIEILEEAMISRLQERS
jgi:hypothetical protein